MRLISGKVTESDDWIHTDHIVYLILSPHLSYFIHIYPPFFCFGIFGFCPTQLSVRYVSLELCAEVLGLADASCWQQVTFKFRVLKGTRMDQNGPIPEVILSYTFIFSFYFDWLWLRLDFWEGFWCLQSVGWNDIEIRYLLTSSDLVVHVLWFLLYLVLFIMICGNGTNFDAATKPLSMIEIKSWVTWCKYGRFKNHFILYIQGIPKIQWSKTLHHWESRLWEQIHSVFWNILDVFVFLWICLVFFVLRIV